MKRDVESTYWRMFIASLELEELPFSSLIDLVAC
jgi:hypothetical protein